MINLEEFLYRWQIKRVPECVLKHGCGMSAWQFNIYVDGMVREVNVSKVVGEVVVVVVGQTVGSISSRTLAYDCLCTLELCTASMIATS